MLKRKKNSQYLHELVLIFICFEIANVIDMTWRSKISLEKISANSFMKSYKINRIHLMNENRNRNQVALIGMFGML